MDNSRLDEIHDRYFEVLSYLDDFCSEHEITFYLWAGTLLGAARDGDFIQWDDDADVAMTGEDFDKLMQLRDKLDKRYLLLTPPQKGKHFSDFVVRLYDTQTRVEYRDEVDSTVPDYLGLDIFVMEEAPRTKVGMLLHCLGIRFIYGLALGHRERREFSTVGSATADRGSFEEFVARCLARIGRRYSLRAIMNRYRRFVRKYRGHGTGYVYASNDQITEIVPKKRDTADMYKKGRRLALRGREFDAPYNWEFWLKRNYGDWRTPVRDEGATHLEH